MILKKNKKRGALFFTVDTFVAAGIFLVTAITILSFYIDNPDLQDTNIVLSNYVTYVTETKMEDFQNIYRNVYSVQNESDPKSPLYEKVAKLIYENNETQAYILVRNSTEEIPTLVPKQFGMSYSLDEKLIYNRSAGISKDVRTNLSFKLLTYHSLDSGEIIGPNITQINIWS